MLALIKLEITKLYKVLILLTSTFIIFSVVLIPLFFYGYSYQYNIEVWTESYNLILFLFPIFCTVPTTWLMYYEKKNNFFIYNIIRTDARKYFLSKLIVHSIYGFLITFLMSMFQLIIVLFFIEPVSGPVNPINVFQLNIFLEQPFLYGLILSLWRSFISILFVILGFMISLCFHNIFLVLTLPFIYYLFENIILSTIGLPNFRILTSIGVASGGYTYNLQFSDLLIGPFILVVIEIVFAFIIWKANALARK